MATTTHSQAPSPAPSWADAAPPPGESRLAWIEDAIRRLEERFGKRVVYRLSQARPKLGARAVSTGSRGLDHATGIGGVPRGRLATIDGAESSGKATIGYHVVAAAQSNGGLAAFIDAEQSADAAEMVACGVDLADLILGQPQSAFEALMIAELLLRSSALDAVVVSALPRGIAPPLLAEVTRRLNATLAGSPTALVFVGALGPRGLGAPAFAAFASLSLLLRPLDLVFRAGGDVAGARVRAEVVKNRCAASGGAAEFVLLEGRGIHRQAELFEIGRRLGVVVETPQGFVYDGELLARGRDLTVACLERERGVASRLEREVSDRLGLGA